MVRKGSLAHLARAEDADRRVPAEQFQHAVQCRARVRRLVMMLEN